MDNNQGNNQNRQSVRPNIQNQPVRPNIQGKQMQGPQMQSQPVRPNMQSQPVRPNMQSQPVRPNATNNEGSRVSIQKQPVRLNVQNEQMYEQSQQIDIDAESNMSDQYADNEFEEINSTIVNDTVAKNKEQGRKLGKKQKKVKEKKELTPEQKKKRIIIAVVIAVVIVALLVIVNIVRNLLEDSSKHISVATGDNTQETVATEQEPVGQQETDSQTDQNEQNTDNEENEQSETEVKSVTNITARESSESNPLDTGEYSSLKFVVNTKTAEDNSYVDRDAEVYVRLSNVVNGYTGASKYIKEFNETNVYNKVINIPDMKEYYSKSNGTEMTMVEFELLYPSDFPTSASEGVVYRIPVASLEVYGISKGITPDDIIEMNKANGIEDESQMDMDTSHYIMTEDSISNLPKITDISVYEINEDKGIKVGEPVKFRYILALPVGASSDVYGFKLNLALDKEDMEKDLGEFWFKGPEVKESLELEQFISSKTPVVEESVEDETLTEDDTEENN